MVDCEVLFLVSKQDGRTGCTGLAGVLLSSRLRGEEERRGPHSFLSVCCTATPEPPPAGVTTLQSEFTAGERNKPKVHALTQLEESRSVQLCVVIVF